MTFVSGKKMVFAAWSTRYGIQFLKMSFFILVYDSSNLATYLQACAGETNAWSIDSIAANKAADGKAYNDTPFKEKSCCGKADADHTCRVSISK